MVRRADTSSLPHIEMAPRLPEAQVHRALLHASTVVRADLCVRLHAVLPPELVPLVAHAMAVPDASLHREAAARCLGFSRRTLHRRLVQAGWPAPRRFLTSLRLLVAAGLLDHGIPCLNRIAWHLSFSDGVALAKALRGFSGVTVSHLRAHGALSQCLARLHASPDTGTNAAAPIRMPLAR